MPEGHQSLTLQGITKTQALLALTIAETLLAALAAAIFVIFTDGVPPTASLGLGGAVGLCWAITIAVAVDERLSGGRSHA